MEPTAAFAVCLQGRFANRPYKYCEQHLEHLPFDHDIASSL